VVTQHPQARTTAIGPHYDKAASRYDGAIRLFEQWFVEDGRE